MQWKKVSTNELAYVISYHGGKRPPQKRPILLQIKTKDAQIPNKICVGWFKYYAGMKESGGFIIPGNGGQVIAWCDCLPHPFEWPKDMLDE